MSKEFTEEEQSILKEVAITLDEVYVYTRKGVSQNKWVIVVDLDMEYWNSDLGDTTFVPEALVGTWMMEQGDDLHHHSFEYCLDMHNWVRCEQVEKVVTVWEEVK